MKKIAVVAVILILGAGSYFAGAYFNDKRDIGNKQSSMRGAGSRVAGQAFQEGRPDFMGEIKSVEDGKIIISKYEDLPAQERVRERAVGGAEGAPAGAGSGAGMRGGFAGGTGGVDRERKIVGEEEIIVGEETKIQKLDADRNMTEIVLEELKEGDRVSVTLDENSEGKIAKTIMLNSFQRQN